jgi:hypothetical protein
MSPTVKKWLSDEPHCNNPIYVSPIFPIRKLHNNQLCYLQT